MSRSISAVIAFGLAAVCFAQRTSELSGRVTDASQAVIANTKVTITNVDTRVERATMSNELGYFTAPLLSPGNYQITVQHDGFRPITRSGITLVVDQTARIDFVMQVGAVTEKVEVTANASVVETQISTLKGVVDEQRIRELPLNGRDAGQLILLMPGVYGTTDTSGLQQGGSGRGIIQPGISSNGARGNMVNYSLDGAYHNDGYTNVSLPIPDPDALQEFSVQTNGFSAEYGRNAGGIVNAVTRSGTNALHGTLFEFHRNAAVNALSFFSTAPDGLKRNQFGGTLGGPVYIPHVYDGRDHTFFFFSIQDQTQVQTPTDASTTVLTQAQRNGDFSARSAAINDPTTGKPFPGNQIPLARMNIVTKNLLNSVIPLPTNSATGLLRYSVPATNNFRQYLIKVDHNFGSKDMLSVHYFDTYYHVPSYNVGLIFSLTSQVQAPSHDLAASYTHIFSPSTIDQVQFALIRRTASNLPVWTQNFKQFGVKNIGTDTSVAAQELILSVSGAFSFDVGETDVTSPNAASISNTLRHTSGRHETAFGFEFRREGLNKFYHFLMDPQFIFNGNATGYGVADFYLGTVDSLVQSAFGERANLSHPSYTAFAQDNIQITPHFKLNLGLRFEPFIPWSDADGRGVAFRVGQQSTVYPKAPLGLLVAGDKGVPSGLTNSSIWNFAPRFGFAWTPVGSKTVVRGGWGIFLDSSMMSAIGNRFENSPPLGMRVTVTPPPGPFEDPFLGNSPFPLPYPPPHDVTFPQNLVAISYPQNWKDAYIQSWNLTVERELQNNWLARLTYAGSKGTALLQGYEGNAGTFGPTATRGNLISRQPYAPAFTTLTQFCFCGNSEFQSLQATIEKRFSQRFSGLLNYTFAKSLDYGSGAGTLWPSYSDPFYFKHDRGLSDFYHKQRLVLSWLWELPRLKGRNTVLRGVVGGWDLNGILTLQTGAPFSLPSGVDNSYSGVNADRADQVFADASVATPNPKSWFNTKAFAANAVGTFGNTSRNLLLGPGITNVDMSLVKNFIVRERWNLQFRGEAFDLANHPNFSQPVGNLSSATYGQITGSSAGRILQGAIKLRW
jgi:hypothetical protein